MHQIHVHVHVHIPLQDLQPAARKECKASKGKAGYDETPAEGVLKKS